LIRSISSLELIVRSVIYVVWANPTYLMERKMASLLSSKQFPHFIDETLGDL